MADPVVMFPLVRVFGTTDARWLAGKQLEESGELRDAVADWLDSPSDASRTMALDEMADLLQTVANLCHAMRVDKAELAAALVRCWEKNMRREHEDGGVDADGVPFRPNGCVRVLADGRLGTVAPSDDWLTRRDGVRLLHVLFPDGGSGWFGPDELAHTG